MNVFTRSPFALDSMWDDPTFVRGLEDWYDETLTPRANELHEETGLAGYSCAGSRCSKSEQSFSERLEATGDSLPEPESFSEWLSRSGDSI